LNKGFQMKDFFINIGMSHMRPNEIMNFGKTNNAMQGGKSA